MEVNSIMQTLLNAFGILGLILVMSFLMYGMIKGLNMEKETRMKNKRRYS